MAREYYAVRVRIDEQDLYFIWFSDEIDGGFADFDGEVPTFEDFNKLLIYSERQNIAFKEKKISFYDLDKIENSINQDSFEVNCVDFLNTWNLFKDVSYSTDSNFDSNQKITNKIYDKLFWGNNLPAVMPKGKCYEPIWSKKELKIIREILLEGFSIFRSNLKIFND